MTEHGYPFGHAQPPAVRRQPAGIARLTVSNALAERFFPFRSFFIYRDNAAFYLWRCQQRAWMLRGALVGISCRVGRICGGSTDAQEFDSCPPRGRDAPAHLYGALQRGCSYGSRCGGEPRRFHHPCINRPPRATFAQLSRQRAGGQ